MLTSRKFLNEYEQDIYRAMLLRKGAINVARQAFERYDKVSV